jgi:FlaG/FlaF family flagellin (archaellin)
MVAITVILAAVIASFVLGLGDQAGQTTPQVNWNFDYENDSSATGSSPDFDLGDEGVLTITHDGGASVDGEDLSLTDGPTDGNREDDLSSAQSEFSAGSTMTVDIDAHDEVSVIYNAESGDSSSTLATFEGPDA